MNSEEKLAICAMSARYDVSCSSSGSSRPNNGGTGNGTIAGCCHSWADDGRCISLLKVLQSNACSHDCAYCINRRTNDIPRATFEPEELAKLVMEFYRRNYIEGLFLSSAVVGTPDYSMELMLRTVTLLRKKYRFNGYIHIKVMPGASRVLIDRAGFLADRISANIELPTSKGLELLAPDKHPKLVMGSIRDISGKIREISDTRKKIQSTPMYAPAGQSTQLIVGATSDSDKTIISLSESLYDKLSLKRVYYSAFIPVVKDTRLPALVNPPLKREHRLYQADWLLRFYGFRAGELLDDSHPDLELECDPKVSWALRHYGFFPLEVNRASYEELLRVPGIGVKSAQRIVRARRHCTLDEQGLKRLGVVLKRAKYFLTCAGKGIHKTVYPEAVYADLADTKPTVSIGELRAGQMSLFPQMPKLLPIEISQEI